MKKLCCLIGCLCIIGGAIGGVAIGLSSTYQNDYTVFGWMTFIAGLVSSVIYFALGKVLSELEIIKSSLGQPPKNIKEGECITKPKYSDARYKKIKIRSNPRRSNHV